jgi:pyruvate,water dikinase
MSLWLFDTEPDDEFPLYTRGNIGEVFPDVISPLTFTLNVKRMEDGWRRLWTDDGHILDPSERPFRILGYFGGYGYLNLSIIRRAADLSPGTSPEEIDHQFFAIGITLPTYEPPDEPGYDARRDLVASWVESLLKDPPVASVEADRVMAFEIRRRNRERRPSMTELSLLADMRDAARRLEQLFYDHIMTSGLSSVAFGALQMGLRERLGERGDDLARRAVSGVGDVDSAAPAGRIAAMRPGDDDALRSFLDDYGFRGANEWELAAPSWELVPDVVRELVAKAAGADAKRPPGDVRAEAIDEIRRSIRWDELDGWLGLAAWYVSARERTKTNNIVLVNEQRLDAHELARRLDVAPERVFLMTMDELEAAVRTRAFPDDLDARAARLAELRTRMAPLVVFGEVPPFEDWLPLGAVSGDVATEELRGVAGSPGTARGRARVVLDPYRSTPPSPGEVLVAPITDPGWTPMFVPAAAVVVEVGGELSHAVIVARELGIPAVVAAAGACSVLRDGDLVEVDGSAGVVRVLERA